MIIKSIMSPIYFILFLCVKLYYFTGTNAIDEVVNIKIKHNAGTLEVNLKRTNRHLFNKNLPVWSAEKDKKPQRIDSVESLLEDMVLYQDLEKSAAVVYLITSKVFLGFIGMRFYMSQFKLDIKNPGKYYKVNKDKIFFYKQCRHCSHESPNDVLLDGLSYEEIKYIISLLDQADIGNIFEPSSLDNLKKHNLPSTSAQSFLDGIHNFVNEFITSQSLQPKVLYPEILLYVQNDMFKILNPGNLNQKVKLAVLLQLIRFNAIDMLFAKLSTDDIKINLNIAGIILETDAQVIPSSGSHTGQSHNVRKKVNGHLLLHELSKYIFQHRDIFVEDSFDFIFLSTTFPILTTRGQVQGFHSKPIDIFYQRVLGKTYQKLMGAVVRSTSSFVDVVNSAKNIAHLMGISNDKNTAVLEKNANCNSIMQSGSHCDNCLKWSDESRESLKKYVRWNNNHCYLLNYPRSLKPYGQPIISLKPKDQCMCYGFFEENLPLAYMETIPSYTCNREIFCSNDLSFYPYFPLPLDGTPCGNNMVCWRKDCVEIGQSSLRDVSEEPKKKKSRPNPVDDRAYPQSS